MKRILSLLVIMLACGSAQPIAAQESVENELDLVRQLRNKGWNDLARARIDELLKRNDPALAAALPLEMARVNIAEARQKDPEQRFALFTTARAQLQDYISKNQGKATAALASVELARLATYHAQALLSKAMREEDSAGKHKSARPAETKFLEAGTDLEQATKLIEAALADPNNSMHKAALERELKQVRFDAAINIFDQARTYIDTGSTDLLEKRSLIVAKAKAAFLELRKEEASHVGWLANAWLMKCSMEIQTPGDVNKYYEAIMKRKDDKTVQPDIQPAIRLARFFHLQDVTLPREDSERIGGNAIGEKLKLKRTPKDRLHEVEKEGEAWLKAYANYLKTYEGQGVRFEVAYAYFTEAQGEKDQKVAAGPLYDKAMFHFDKLAELDGDLAERARQTSTRIKFTRLGVTKAADLRTFADFKMKAEIDRNSVVKASGKLAELAKKAAKGGQDDTVLKAERKTFEAERKNALKNVINSLNKALVLATSKTPPKDIDAARDLLSGAYLAYGDAYRGAIVAEAIARARATGQAPKSAGTAIATYASIAGRDPTNAVVKQRLQDMADFVLAEKNWAADPVASLAHYHLAMSVRESRAIEEAESITIKAEEARTQKKLTDDEVAKIKAATYKAKIKEALDHLEKIDKDFVDYIYTQGQLVFIAESAREKMAEASRQTGIDTKKEQKELIDAAKRAIARMTKLNLQTDSPNVITMYFFAKVEQAKYLYAEAIEDLRDPAGELKAVKKCNDMRKYVTDLRGEFDKVPGKVLSDENREQLDFTMGIMLKYADLGIAEAKFRSDRKDRFDEVIEATKTVVNDTLEKGKAGGDIKLKDYRVTGDILGLALRANVQKGDVVKGKAILDVLQRLSSETGQKSGNVIGALLNDIAGQIKRMKDEKDPALVKTKDNYTAFLDVIAKEYEAKGFEANAAMMLAHAFNSLEYPQKAATMFSKIKPPANLDKKVVKAKQETDDEIKDRQAWEEAVGKYWGVQIEYIRALRASKDKESLEKAEKALQALIANPNARYKIQAMMEKNFLLEDAQKYIEAYNEWQKVLKMTGGNLSDPNAQKIYFPSYFYSIRVVFKMGAFDPRIKNRQKYIDFAANNIVRLETQVSREGWDLTGHMYKELLKDKDAELLKKAYDALKATKKGASLRDPRSELRTLASAGFSNSITRIEVARFLAPEGRQSIARGESPWNGDEHPRQALEGRKRHFRPFRA